LEKRIGLFIASSTTLLQYLNFCCFLSLQILFNKIQYLLPVLIKVGYIEDREKFG